jgi:hypothetical protein
MRSQYTHNDVYSQRMKHQDHSTKDVYGTFLKEHNVVQRLHTFNQVSFDRLAISFVFNETTPP